MVNSSKYRKESNFNIGDKVLVRNYGKSAKFDAIFLHQPFKIIDVNEAGNKIIVEQEEKGFTLCRHPDDIKPFKRYQEKFEEQQEDSEEIRLPEADEGDGDGCFDEEETVPPLRRSQRIRKPDSKYL